MKIDCKGRTGSDLCLGIQTKKGNVNNDAIWKANVWAPKQAKSFTINNLIHTNYSGMPKNEETGFATIYVSYYTTKKEGKNIIERS